MEDKLPQEFKKNWTAALRSGKYKQGEGKLCSAEKREGLLKIFKKKRNTFCCLGVACIVADVKYSLYDTSYIPYSDTRFNNVPTLIRGDTLNNKVVTFLSASNDGTGDCKKLSFPEIADWIDENL